MNVLELMDVSIIYQNTKEAVKHVSFAVPEGKDCCHRRGIRKRQVNAHPCCHRIAARRRRAGIGTDPFW